MPQKQMTLVIDLDRCIGCCACEVACKQENDVDLEVNWNKVLNVGPIGTFPEVEQYFLPAVCQQCEKPACVQVCPTGASYKRAEDGIVLINKEICIGCRYCMMACPYGVRNFNQQKKVVEKCTLCIQLQAIDEKPACVKNCPGGARIFGDIKDPNSDVSKALQKATSDATHQLPDVGNKPTGRYILHGKNATWRS
jgi:Fe-S-cluster-containing dehydrogenase component